MGYELFWEKIIVPSTPVLGINYDQSLILDTSLQKPENILKSCL